MRFDCAANDIDASAYWMPAFAGMTKLNSL
jgi:hypothetical protein